MLLIFDFDGVASDQHQLLPLHVFSKPKDQSVPLFFTIRKWKLNKKFLWRYIKKTKKEKLKAMIRSAPHNSLLTVHFCFRVCRYFPPGWLFPWRRAPCPAEMWHSSYRHGKEIRLWVPPAKGHQRQRCETRAPLDNHQTLAHWLWLWKHKKGLLGVVWKTWCWISWYESLHVAHLLCFPWEYLQRWMSSENK